ncbi:MAG: hypothetical protein WB647_07785 [Roseiarcus sp.]|uniref:hypothetical protein n=1 Tax=Roseiarcus sp. TaxID=1969460 RepID=UPI003C511E79
MSDGESKDQDWVSAILQAVALIGAANLRQHSGRVGSPTHVNDLPAYESVRDEGTRICVISSTPFRRKLFALERIEELVLARPDRKALANAAIEFAAEFRFVTWQGRDNFRQTAEARHPASAKRQQHQNQRCGWPHRAAHQVHSGAAICSRTSDAVKTNGIALISASASAKCAVNGHLLSRSEKLRRLSGEIR